MQEHHKIRQMTFYALMTAVLCIFAPMSIPIGTVPVSFTNFVLYISAIIIGYKGATVSYVLYVLIGCVGVPVFAGYKGGFAIIIGPTGGFLIGFILITAIGGFVCEHMPNSVKFAAVILAFIFSTACCYMIGTFWYAKQMGCSFSVALTICVYPFIIFDLGKILTGTFIGINVRKTLVRQHIL